MQCELQLRSRLDRGLQITDKFSFNFLKGIKMDNEQSAPAVSEVQAAEADVMAAVDSVETSVDHPAHSLLDDIEAFIAKIRAAL